MGVGLNIACACFGPGHSTAAGSLVVRLSTQTSGLEDGVRRWESRNPWVLAEDPGSSRSQLVESHKVDSNRRTSGKRDLRHQEGSKQARSNVGLKANLSDRPHSR